jgi:hypothetical protein
MYHGQPLMGDLFSDGDQSASGERRDSSSPIRHPLRIDPYVASSLLQKAIRRGDADLSERAAVTLHRMRGKGLWRRFLVIAFEDVGIGSLEALTKTTAVCMDPNWRSRFGGDERALCFVARLLADAPKDRSADHLIGAAWSHPKFEEQRQRVGARSLAERVELVMDSNLPLPVRAIAAWHASGMEWGRERRVGRGDLPGLMSAFKMLGAPPDLILATRHAAMGAREPIVVMPPLIWLAAHRGPRPSVVECPVPPAPVVDGVPMYAFDKHTAIGKAAIHRLARENAAVRDVLAAFVPGNRAKETACMAAFYADAAPVSRRLEWRGSSALEEMGVENDMLRAGAALEGIQPILTLMRDNLDPLNAIRAGMFAAGRRFSNPRG